MSYDDRETTPPATVVRKQLRPAGWNHAIAVQRAAARLAKLHARNLRRGLRNRVPVELGGTLGADNRKARGRVATPLDHNTP